MSVVDDLRVFCIDIDSSSGDWCISFPGGAELCLQLPDAIPPNPDKIARQLFAQLNTALAPMTPIFNIIDAVQAIFDCLKAVATLDPQEIISCLPGLAEKVSALLSILPQYSIPAMLASILEVLILYLQGTRNQYLRLIEHLTRILNAGTAATRPGNAALARVLPCALEDFDKLIVWQNEGKKPLNRLIGVINTFLELVGLGKFAIPCLGEIFADLTLLEAAVVVLDELIELLRIIRLAIPIPTGPQFSGGTIGGVGC